MADPVSSPKRDMRPVAPPRLIDEAYSPAQHAAVMDVIRDHGPWPMITKGRFRNIEQVAASTSGRIDPDISLESFITPQFRGWFASHGACYHTELDEIFFDPRLRGFVRDYWGAEFARPTFMFFGLSGPFENVDRGHIDGVNFRGVGKENTPLWIMSLMGKSGLFDRWQIKMAQVVAWWSHCEVGGFTYWPDGIAGAPKRVEAPLWNKGLVVQNECMFHRAESSGPPERRNPPGLTFDTELGVDPRDRDIWLMKTGDLVNDRFRTDELRLMLHWNAEVYWDLDDLRLHSDHRDDLTHEMVAEIFIADLRKRGIPFEVPSDPYNDMPFIAALNDAYDPGLPRIYPENARPLAA